MHDVQNQRDDRGIAIDQVGITDLTLPIRVRDEAGGHQSTIARVTMSVDLPAHRRGAHMSRFVEVLRRRHVDVSVVTLPAILHELAARLAARHASVKLAFPYCLERTAPVSGARAAMAYQCTLAGRVDARGVALTLGVRVPVTSLCPCSKAISDYGAHNQRGYVTTRVRSAMADDGTPRPVWIEDVIAVAERAASAPVYPLLKRPDERHVTMQAYERPRFVEDLVREVVFQLRADARIAWCEVHARTQGSIHDHDAFARVQWTRPPRVGVVHHQHLRHASAGRQDAAGSFRVEDPGAVPGSSSMRRVRCGR